MTDRTRPFALFLPIAATLTACGPTPSLFTLTGLPGVPCERAAGAQVLSGTISIGVTPPPAQAVARFGVLIGDGAPVWADAPPWQIPLDTGALADGTVLVHAQVWTAAGAVVDLDGTACVDNHGPSLVVAGPADEATRYVPGADVEWDVRADDQAGVDAITLAIRVDGRQLDVPCTQVANAAHCTLAMAALAPAPPAAPIAAAVRIAATDRRGHETVEFRNLIVRSRMLWAAATNAPVEWTPARGSNGMIYAATTGDFIALREDGSMACRWPLPRPQPDVADPAGTGVALSPDGATAYFGTLRHFYAVDTTTCAPRWGATPDLDGTYQGATPAVDPRTGMIYAGRYGLGAEPGEVLAIAPDGTLRWKLAIADAGAPVGASPLVDPSARRLYIGSSDRNLYAVDLDAGSVVWKYLTGDSIMAAAALAGDRIYVGSHDGLVHAVDRTTGARDAGFTLITGSRIQSTPVVGSDGTVYVASLDGYVYAAAPDGSVRWRYGGGQLELLGSSPQIDAAGLLHLSATVPSRVVTLAPDGRELWTFDPAPGVPDQVEVSASPVLGDGVVYVATKTAVIYALGATP